MQTSDNDYQMFEFPVEEQVRKPTQDGTSCIPPVNGKLAWEGLNGLQHILDCLNKLVPQTLSLLFIP